MSTREEFEMWAKANTDYSLKKRANGVYVHNLTYLAWSSWQSATCVERKACALVCENEAVEEVGDGDKKYNLATVHCAGAIRARGDA